MLAFRSFCFMVTMGLSAPAVAAPDPFASDWASALRSSARLIVGDASGGRFHAGLEIKLAPGAITYWRNPGDAGLPPVFDFEGSANLASAEPFFPAPQRLNEGDGEAFGYDHSVILPIDVQAADPGRPVDLVMKLSYAVCEKICVPAKADLRLRLGGDRGPSPYADAVVRARAEVPRVAPWTSLSNQASIVALDEKAWRFCLAASLGAPRDVFVETPSPWWFAVAREPDSAETRSCFRVTLEQKPDDQSLPVKARLTVTGADAFETDAVFGAPPSQ